MSDAAKTREQLIEELAHLRRRCEALERQSRELSLDGFQPGDWRRLIDGSPVLVAVLDSQYRIAYLNRLESDVPREMVVGHSILDFCPPDWRDWLRGHIDHVLTSGESAVDEMPIVRGDGSSQWYMGFLGPVRRDGRVVAASLMAVNMSARRNAEIERDRLRSYLNAVVESIPVEILAIDKQWRCTLQNALYRQVAGDIVGRPFAEVCPPALLARMEREVPLAFSGEQVTGEVVAEVDGVEVHHVYAISPIRDQAGIVGVIGARLDVTESKRAERELKKSEERYRTLLELAPQIISRFDATGRLLDSNGRWEEVTGQTREEAAGLGWLEAIHNDDIPGILAAIPEAGVAWSVYEMEYRARCAGGEYRWFLARVVPAGKGPRANGDWIIVSTDIHERKLAEEALRESRQELERVLASVSDYLWSADVDTDGSVHYRYYSPVTEAITGYPPEHFLEASGRWLSTIHPEDQPRMALIAKRLCAGESAHEEDEYRTIWPDGSIHWVRDSVTVRRQANGMLRLDGVASNITDRKLAETALRRANDDLEQQVKERTAELTAANRQLEAEIEQRHQADESLRASEERFRVAFEEAPLGMAICNADSVIVRVNRATRMLLGYAVAELVGQDLRGFIHADDRVQSAPMQARLLAGEIPSYTVECRYVKKGGRVYWGEATTAAVCNEEGALDFYLVIINDITDRKVAQEAVLRERQTLRHLLRSSDHERQLIAYEIHDGLAQQLTGAILQLQACAHQRGLDASKAQQAFEAGAAMLQQAHFEARRLISGVRPPVLDESGILTAIAHLIHDHQYVHGPQIELRSRVTFERLAPILENAIYRIVQEALNNACKHSQCQRVRIAVVQQGEIIHVSVRDWGVGFRMDQVGEECFGLEGIRERARLLGGRCWIRSRAGQGTQVRVQLPMALVE